MSTINCYFGEGIDNSEEIRDVRNVIEHLEEYIVGKGNKPELVIDVERHMGLSFGGPKSELFIGI